MQDIFVAIEQSALSVWMREDEYAYFIALIFHAFGMALLVGGGIVICLRALGIGSGAAMEKFRGFLPVLWIGAVTAIASGLLLLAAYPAKALTNPLFFVKLVCLVGAAWLMRHALNGSRKLAAIALVLWLAGVAAGKLLLHTYTVLTVS
jgi:hypothetical protein